ncbi:MAG: hypothetical protein L0Y54_05660 [Sporichthyaceae bacterium]|nr:hypothetical protein [Sporichthyaceae bacterium]
MFRLGKEKPLRQKPVRRAEKAGAAVGRRVDKVTPKVAHGWHKAVDSTSTAGSEAKVRGKATYYALKGDLRPAEPANHRKRNIALAVGALGAGATAAYVAARRRRQPEWLTADITPETGTTSATGKTPAAAKTSSTQTSWTRPSQPATTGRPAPASARVGDRGAASVDEMLADVAESAQKATSSGTRPMTPPHH